MEPVFRTLEIAGRTAVRATGTRITYQGLEHIPASGGAVRTYSAGLAPMRGLTSTPFLQVLCGIWRSRQIAARHLHPAASRSGNLIEG